MFLIFGVFVDLDLTTNFRIYFISWVIFKNETKSFLFLEFKRFSWINLIIIITKTKWHVRIFGWISGTLWQISLSNETFRTCRASRHFGVKHSSLNLLHFWLYDIVAIFRGIMATLGESYKYFWCFISCLLLVQSTVLRRLYALRKNHSPRK